MSKNAIIGILVAAIIIIGGYYLLTSNNNTLTDQSGSNTQTPATSTPPANSPGTPSTNNPVLTLGKPIVETNPSASTSISTALVTGQVVPNGAGTVYWFDYGETTSLGKKTAGQQIGAGFSPISSPAYITGLKANTVYYFRLTASNNFGTVNGAIENFKTNSNPAPTAALPRARTTSSSDIARTSATVSGEVTPNGFDTKYWFEYGKDASFNNSTGSKSLDASSSTTLVSASLSSLDPLTKYYFRLDAQNQFGTVNGSTLSFTTKGPVSSSTPSVTTSQASSIHTADAKLNGRINPNGAETTYWFEYSEDSLLGSLIGNGTPAQTLSAGTSVVNVQANVDGLSKSTKYYFRLVGRNQYGTVNGSIMSFTTKP